MSERRVVDTALSAEMPGVLSVFEEHMPGGAIGCGLGLPVKCT